MICPNCESEVNTNHDNIYGHVCPYCHTNIPPLKKPEFITRNENQLNLLRATARQLLRETLENRSNNMPISHDNANITIEFTWQSDDDATQLHVKHHVVDGNPIISVSDNGTDWYNFPATFFREVTDFLNQQRISKPVVAAKQFRSGASNAPAIERNLAQSKHSYGNSSLPVPQIGASEENQYVGIELADTEPLESFGGLEKIAEGVSVARPKHKVASTKRKKQIEEEVITRPVIRGATEEMSKMLRGGPNPDKSFRSNHREF